MNKFFSILKLFVNVILLAIYCVFAVLLGDFLYGAFLTYIAGLEVPGTNDPSHWKMAIISIIFTIIITLILRRFFYLQVFNDEEYTKKKHTTKKDKMKIYVNKEIK